MQPPKNRLYLSFYKLKKKKRKKAKISVHTKQDFKVSPKESRFKDDFGHIS